MEGWSQSSYKALLWGYGLKQAIVKQSVHDINHIYLKALQVQTWATVIKTVPEILNYLFDNYGFIIQEELDTFEEYIKNMTYTC